MPRHDSKESGQGFEAGRYALIESEIGADAVRDLELVARTLLKRWGVVFRALLERECTGIPWRLLLRTLRDLEARGEVRGGRFVTGFSGEQYALPEAVSLLRKLRREPLTGELVVLSASDPLNLVGLITPGARIAQQPAGRILLRDGVPVASLVAGTCRWLDHGLFELTEGERDALECTLREERDPRATRSVVEQSTAVV